MVTAKPVVIRCPTCSRPMEHFTEVLFLSNFTVVLNGLCCQSEVTSGELPILTLFPETKERGH